MLEHHKIETNAHFERQIQCFQKCQPLINWSEAKYILNNDIKTNELTKAIREADRLRHFNILP